MKIKIKNNTDEIIYLSDLGNLSFLPGEYTELDTITNQLVDSDQLVDYIAKNELIVNNFTNDMSPTDGIKWILTGAEQYLKDPKTGKMIVQETSKYPGLYTYWTGKGDDTANNIIGEGDSLIVHHRIGEPMETVVYADFFTIDNLTQMHEGYVVWKDAQPGDRASLMVVTTAMQWQPGLNTNYNIYGGYLIVPAAGDGNIDLLSDPTSTNPATGCLMEREIDETGVVQPAFWNADFNSSTNEFENITPAPMGNGKYNMFAGEIPVSRFVNQIPFVGNGFERLQSADSDMFNHGLRIKLVANTSDIVDDHEWTFSAILTLQRDKTITT